MAGSSCCWRRHLVLPSVFVLLAILSLSNSQKPFAISVQNRQQLENITSDETQNSSTSVSPDQQQTETSNSSIAPTNGTSVNASTDTDDSATTNVMNSTIGVNATTNLDNPTDTTNTTTNLDNSTATTNATTNLDNSTATTNATTNLDNSTDTTNTATNLDNSTDTTNTTTNLDNSTDTTNTTTNLDNPTDTTNATTNLDNSTDTTNATTNLDNSTATTNTTTNLDNGTATTIAMNSSYTTGGVNESSTTSIMNSTTTAASSNGSITGTTQGPIFVPAPSYNSTKEPTKPPLPEELREVFSRPNQNEGKEFWMKKGQDELTKSLQMTLNTNKAKNVILFLGDGLGIPTIVASRIYKGQLQKVSGEEQELYFETFPYVGLSKTYCVDKQVPDSASTGTAYLTGVKANFQTLGVDSSVQLGNCRTVTEESKVTSIAQWALDAGMRAGIVSSTRITHATPAASYAHSSHRDYECDEMIPAEMKQLCPHIKDIARQLIEDEPGKRFHVILGGGYQCFNGNVSNSTGDPVDEQDCQRQDGRDLFQQWQDDKKAEGKTFSAVRTKSDLLSDKVNDSEYLLGLFANSHLPYEFEKLKMGLDMPSLEDMTKRAIQVLQQGDEGFFLLVEGGRIDHAHHEGTARKALEETLAFEDAVRAGVQMVDTEETLVVVTADHSHVMTINGYPLRGQSIIGLGDMGTDNLPYTTLMYTNGKGFKYKSLNSTHGGRWNISYDEVTDMEYEQLSAVPLDDETHGGEDVSIYAIGPMSHLFHGVHEQNYIAHVMGYAACIGANQDHCAEGNTASQTNNISSGLLLSLVILNYLTCLLFR